MSPNNQPPVDLEVADINFYIEEALMILGKSWFDRRLSKESQEREVVKNRNHGRQRVQHIAPHKLVQWYIEYKEWRDAYTPENNIPLNQSALLLLTFASNLLKVRYVDGLEQIVLRLRKPNEFMTTSLEVEVATGYVNRGWNVEFVETGRERSPDLKITTDDGKVFWAECKYRDEMTGRDVQVSKFWEQLQDKLYRHWGPAKINVALIVKSACDPANQELQSLADAILQAAQAMVSHSERTHLEPRGKSHDHKYEFNLHHLADPDDEQQLQGFSDLGADWFSWHGEVMHDGKGNSFVRNPKFFGFTNMNPPDRYIGALNSFNSAVGQLPESGPGVIWIRIPYPDDTSFIQADLEAMAAKIERELSGGHNTRVNCVILSTRVFSTESNEGRPALTLRHVSAPIAHKSPRHVL